MEKSLGKRLRFVFGRTAYFWASVGLCLLCLEGLLRLFPLPNSVRLNQQLIGIWESDDELLMRPRPLQDSHITAHPEFQFRVQTNSAGWRDDDPPGGSFELAIIGDSMTFGYGVEGHEAYPAVLQEISGWRVANLGWQGWNSYVYPAALEHFAQSNQASVWLWAFFCNDLAESAGAEQFLREQASQVGMGFKEYSSQNQLWGFPYNLYLVSTAISYLIPGGGFLEQSENTWFERDGLAMMISDYPWRMSEASDPNVMRGWELTAQSLEHAHLLAQEHGVILAVIFLPSREQVYEDWIASDLPPGRDLAALAAVEERVASLAAAYELPYFNLQPGLKAAVGPGNLLYFAGDAHFNLAGNQVAAELLFAWLSQQGWLPAATP